MPNDLKHLQPHHMRIMELTLEGLRREEIASMVEMTPQQISNIINSPVFQDELARRREERNVVHDRVSADTLTRAKQRLEEATEAAVVVLESHLNSTDARIQQSAAKDILDRVFKKDGDMTGNRVVLNVDTIQILINAMKESQ